MLEDKRNQNLSHRFLFSPVITKNDGEVISKDSNSDCRLDQGGSLCYIFLMSSLAKDFFSGLNPKKKKKQTPKNAIFVESVRIFLVPLSMLSISDHK